MATSKDFQNDWDLLLDKHADYWTATDLQLAAELGKTLLERNKELENNIKLYQATVEEQAQEIEYTKKQTAALREVNDSRMKIYEQLEVSIQDLERANHRLVVDNSNDKKIIKSKMLIIAELETRCEELQKRIDELTTERDCLIRQQATSNQSANTGSLGKESATTHDSSMQQTAAPSSPTSSQVTIAADGATLKFVPTTDTNEEETTELLRQLQEARNQRAREQKKVAELGQQLAALLQENTVLEEQLNEWRAKAQDVKNLQDEISTLEEVRQGHLCGRCLRGTDTTPHDELSAMLDQEEYDDVSVAESFINENPRVTEAHTQIGSGGHVEGVMTYGANSDPFRILVQKYEALLEVQKQPTAGRRKNSIPPAGAGAAAAAAVAAASCMSLQEELEMSGEFNGFHSHPLTSENDTRRGGSTKSMTALAKGEQNQPKKPVSATPTDFSEAETSSSGFMDETSNKATQTEGRPGSLLCSIADGEDCKLSIYDDNNPFESRFRKTPKYRQLFSEIFSALKRAAEAKDVAEKAALHENSVSMNNSQADQEISLLKEDAPSETTTDDNQSVMSSVVSSVVSEPPYRLKSLDEQCTNKSNNKKATGVAPQSASNRCRLDYLSVNVDMRKQKSAKKSNARRQLYSDRPTTPDFTPTANPKLVPPKSNSSGKRKFRPFNAPEHDDTSSTYMHRNTQQQHHSNRERSRWSPRDKQTFRHSRTANEQQNNISGGGGAGSCNGAGNGIEYREYRPSAASKEVAQLKRLEMTYAQALRMPNKSKASNHHRNY